MEKSYLTTDFSLLSTENENKVAVVLPEPREPPTVVDEAPDFRPHGYEWFE